MREALARTEHDFSLHDRPRKRRAASRGRVRAVLGVLRRRPMRTVGVLAFAGFAVAVALNALVFQAARHPTPLFGEPARPANVRPKTVIRVADQPIAAPQLRVALPPARPVEGPASTAPIEAPVVSPRDPIGDMIRGGAAPDAPLVLAAQQALVKLGYGPLQVDGVMGAETRLAIERFEKARNLPTSGALTPRMAKALAGAAGMAVE